MQTKVIDGKSRAKFSRPNADQIRSGLSIRAARNQRLLDRLGEVAGLG